MHHNPISIENLNYRYPDGIQALKGINLQIAATEKVAIIGANGSGKSTLLLHLNDILAPPQGEIVIGEMLVMSCNLLAIRNFVGLVFQNPDDQLFMPTIWEDVAFGLMNQGIQGTNLKIRVSDDLDLALELCDRTVVLSEDEIVYDGATKQVLSDQEFLLAHSLEMPLSLSFSQFRLDHDNSL